MNTTANEVRTSKFYLSYGKHDIDVPQRNVMNLALVTLICRGDNQTEENLPTWAFDLIYIGRTRK